MRCAVPSSKVGSCDSANSAAERDSGVDAADGFGAPACAARVVGAAGFAAAPAGVALWPNDGAVASMVAMAMMVVLVRISDAPGRNGANVEIDKLGPAGRANNKGYGSANGFSKE
jgi:hypothetical protein